MESHELSSFINFKLVDNLLNLGNHYNITDCSFELLYLFRTHCFDSQHSQVSFHVTVYGTEKMYPKAPPGKS